MRARFVPVFLIFSCCFMYFYQSIYDGVPTDDFLMTRFDISYVLERNDEIDERNEQNFSNVLPSLPIDEMKYYTLFRKNSTCAHIAPLQFLEYHNDYWQTFRYGAITMHIYSAFFDIRRDLSDGPAIRILALTSNASEPDTIKYCQIWRQYTLRPEIVPVISYNFLWKKRWGQDDWPFYPVLLSCNVKTTEQAYLPQSVSLVESPCENATNRMRVFFERSFNVGPKLPLAICLKGFSFPFSDISSRLIEWLELMRLLGAHRVFLSIYHVHQNVLKVIKYYEDAGYVVSRTTSLPINTPVLKAFQYIKLKKFPVLKYVTDAIIFNDCFYRNIYKYDFIVALDIDEVVIPIRPRNSWNELIQLSSSIENDLCHRWAGLCFRNIDFPTNHDGNRKFPYLPIQHSIKHLPHHSKMDKIKCWHSTDEVLTSDGDFPVSYIRKGSCCHIFNMSLVRLHHYRNIKNPDGLRRLPEDRNIYRFQEDLRKGVTKALTELGLFK